MHLIYYGSQSKNMGYRQQLFNTWIFLVVLLYFRLNSCRLLVYSHSNMSLPSSIPLRVQSQGLTLLLFIPGSGWSDLAGAKSGLPGAVALPRLQQSPLQPSDSVYFPIEERNCFLCSGHLCGWVKDGIVAELKSQGIPSFWGEEGKKKQVFPKKSY